MMMTYCEYIMTIIDRNLIKIPDFRIPAGRNGFKRDSARFCSLRLDRIMLITMITMMTMMTMLTGMIMMLMIKRNAGFLRSLISFP